MSPRGFLVLGGQFAPRRRKDADFAVHLRINHRGIVGKTLPIVFLQLIIHRRAHLPVPGQEAQLTAFQRRLIAALEQQARVVAAKRVIHRRNDFLPRHIHDARQAILLCQHIVAAVITHVVIQRLAVLHRLAQHISLQIQEIACFRVIPDAARHFIRRQQARELGRKVKESGVHIDEILYSPLSRAADTAKAVAEATGLPARCEPRLREQCFGKYEGTPRDGAEFRISKTHFADRYDGGESMMQLAQRIYNLLDELRQDENKTYLLVAHNGIARVVESYFHDMTNEEYSAAGIRNCELVEYHFE